MRKHARTVFLVVGVLMLASELWKQLCLTFLLNGGRYQWAFFPFHLCSVFMYVCVLLYLCWGTEFGNVLLVFMKDSSCSRARLRSAIRPDSGNTDTCRWSFIPTAGMF